MSMVQSLDLASMHPRLLWSEIVAATAAVLESRSNAARFAFDLAIEEVRGFGSDQLSLTIETGGVPVAHIASLRRTYDQPRLVELAAIAVAGIGLHLAGGHEIRDVALHGSGADHLVDNASHLLEVAGRSRRSDFGSAWRERWERLSKAGPSGY